MVVEINPVKNVKSTMDFSTTIWNEVSAWNIANDESDYIPGIDPETGNEIFHYLLKSRVTAAFAVLALIFSTFGFASAMLNVVKGTSRIITVVNMTLSSLCSIVAFSVYAVNVSNQNQNLQELEKVYFESVPNLYVAFAFSVITFIVAAAGAAAALVSNNSIRGEPATNHQKMDNALPQWQNNNMPQRV